LKLTYLNHSGFLLNCKNFAVVIDYYNPAKNAIIYRIVEESLKSESAFYVLSSHSHPDHFDPEILKFKFLRRDIKYIFSKDIENLNFIKDRNMVFLDKFEVYEDDNLKIKAFGSTDLGISFYIKACSKEMFHAGDLNNWHWNEEFTKEETRSAEDFYYSELKDITKEVKHLDLAMFPIDPRLGRDYMKGAIEFLEEIKVKLFAPMHFQGQYEKILAFDEYAKSKGSTLIRWKDNGESIEF